MSLTLVKNAHSLVTMNADREEISNAFIAFENGIIKATGSTENVNDWERQATNIIDATNCVITPGLVNTHHHLFQTLTRSVPSALSAPLFGWLTQLYPIWQRYRPEDMFVSAQLGLAELALSGCTLSSDHLYLYPDGVRLEDTIYAAKTVGIRFHAMRGSMSIGRSKGGLPPDSLVEAEAAILKDCVRVIDKFHDAKDGALVRVGVAPCSPFSVSRDLMRDAAFLARDKNVMMHTHLAENTEDIEYSLEKFGCRPGQYAEELGWVGEDVWHAHCVQLDDDEIKLFADTKTGIAHCPCSNCRLASGIAPIQKMRSKNVPIGLGVDGSASNDSSHILQEARQAMLLQRVQSGANAMDPREALELATIGGAKVLGRNDCGSLEVGKRADLVIWDMSNLQNSGAWDLVAALVMCGPNQARDVFVEGRPIISNGQFIHLDLNEVLTNAASSVNYLKSTQ